MFYPGPVGATFDSGPAGATFDSGPAGATFDPSPADTIIYPGPAVASFNPGAEEATERDTMNGTSRRGGTVRQTCTVPTIPFSRLRRTGRSANQPSHSVASVAPGGRPTNHPFQSSPSRRAVGQPTIPFSRLRRVGRSANLPSHSVASVAPGGLPTKQAFTANHLLRTAAQMQAPANNSHGDHGCRRRKTERFRFRDTPYCGAACRGSKTWLTWRFRGSPLATE